MQDESLYNDLEELAKKNKMEIFYNNEKKTNLSLKKEKLKKQFLPIYYSL